MSMFTSLRPRKRLLLAMAVGGAALLVACGPGGICESDEDRARRVLMEQQTAALLQATPTPTPTSTAAAAKATTAAASTPAASATAAAFAGKIALGFDHPPFEAANANLGGNSAGIVCGLLTGVPGGSIVTINLTGGTGAPASVNGPVGPDGTFIVPFPIRSYGPMNAAIGGVKTAAGAALTGSVPPAALPVAAGPDVACNAR